MPKYYGALFVVLFIVVTAFQRMAPVTNIQETTSVQDALEILGKEVNKHGLNSYTNDMVKAGEQLVKEGISYGEDGKRLRRQSKFFTCTKCHNTVQEDPNLLVFDAEERLTYAMSNNLPFLQATTFKGIVNRESWYNGDYYQKYGDLVDAARYDLREAIQLCATECAQGRLLTDWEMNAVLAYFNSISYTLTDLGLDEEELKQLKTAQKSNKPADKKAAIKNIESKYAKASPATFTDAYSSMQASKILTGNTLRGQAIYELSCQHCHSHTESTTNFKLDFDKVTFKLLENNLDKYNKYSIYQISRFGTKPVLGYKAYMPHYSLDRMTNQQLADLQAYIEEMAE